MCLAMSHLTGRHPSFKRIIIIGDTHMPKRGNKFPPTLMHELKKADLILHTGDWQTLDVVEGLKPLAPVVGVTGNVDGPELVELFGKKKLITIGSYRIGLTHGDGKGKTTEKRALQQFEEEEIDLLIYGHSHIPILKKEGPLTIFNPGSPTDKRRQKQYSFGILELGEKMEIYHVFFDEKE